MHRFALPRADWFVQHAALLREVAIAAHRGQRDQQGEPYRAHVLAVADMVCEDAKPVALLHDVVEDGRLTQAVVAALLGDRDEGS